MINYKLAKKLKDAGFPQSEWTKENPNFLARENGDSKEDEYDFINDRTMLLKYFSDDYLKDMDSRGLIVYIPTLSELIEACGKGENWFSALHQVAGGWRADGYCPQDNDEHPTKFCEEIGSSPEEAVANLWLELNKK